MNILWDNTVPPLMWDVPDFYIRVRSGYSVMLSNRLTTLKREVPVEGVTLDRAIEKLSERLSLPDAQKAYPNVPEIVHYRACTSRGEIDLVLMWGIVLNGAKRKHQLTGEYRFVICLLDEVEEALSSVFEFERVFERMVEFEPIKAQIKV